MIMEDVPTPRDTYLLKRGVYDQPDMTEKLYASVPSLMLMSTARSSNGFRGVHEIFTGTRVVRLGGLLESQRLDRLPVTVATVVETQASFGTYE